MKRAALLVLALAAALVVVPSTAAWACSCASPPTAESVAHADLVVRAVMGTPRKADSGVAYRVTVAETFKGDAVPVVTVRSATDGNTCGLDVVPGREYVLFAVERAGRLEAGLCGGTAPVTAALVARVEAAAGPGRPAAKDPTSPPSTAPRAATPPLTQAAADTDATTSIPVPVGIGALGAVAAAVLLMVRRRRS